MKRTSIRSRLTSRLALLLVAIAVVANGGLYVHLRHELIEQYDAALQAQARAVAALWQATGGSDGAGPAIARAFPNLRFGRPNGDYLRIDRADGTTVLQVPSAKGGELWRDRTRRPTTRRFSYDVTLPNGVAGRAIEIGIAATAEAATTAAEKNPLLALVLAESRQEMDGTLTNFAVGLFAIGGGLSAASIWLVLGIVRRELRPLGDFSDAVSRVDADTLTYRFPTDGLADEFVPVATRLNELLHRLDASFSRERRFTGNVAHELRTPLAELRSMVEVAMKWPPEPDELRRHHGQVLEVVQRMTTVTQALLMLVRSNSGCLGSTLCAVDVVPLLKAATLPHERLAAGRGVGFDFVLPESVTVVTDPAILSSLLDNVFGNAAAYATPGSRIVCEAGEAGEGRVVVTLTNAASDLTADDLPRLDEPFWRKDAARSASDHAGLGLSLVRTYAKALNVDVQFRLTPTAVFAVDIAIPRALTRR